MQHDDLEALVDSLFSDLLSTFQLQGKSSPEILTKLTQLDAFFCGRIKKALKLYMHVEIKRVTRLSDMFYLYKFSYINSNSVVIASDSIKYCSCTEHLNCMLEAKYLSLCIHLLALRLIAFVGFPIDSIGCEDELFDQILII